MRFLFALGLLGCVSRPTLEPPISSTAALHPELRAQRAKWEAVAAAARAAYRWPDPVLSYSYAPRPVETKLGALSHAISVTQRIPWLSKPRTDQARERARAQVEAARYKALGLATQRRVARPYWTRWRIRQQRSLLEAQLKALDALMSGALSAVAIGQTKAATLSEIALWRVRLEERHDALMDEEFSASAQLDGALGGAKIEIKAPRDAALTVTSLKALLEQAAQHPRLQVAQAQLLTRGVELERAQLAKRPDLLVAAKWSIIDEAEGGPPEAGRDALSISAGLTLPLWSEAISSGIEAAEAKQRSAEADLEAERLALSTEISATYAQLNRVARRVHRIKHTLLPQAKSHLKMLSGHFETGHLNLEALLRATLDTLDIEVALIEARAAHAIIWADLEALVGRPLNAAQGAR